MILMIDNYDSFTYNLVHYVMELDVEVEVVRNDAISVDQAFNFGPEAVILSPGPCTPNEAGISLDMVAACARRSVPLLGVCLGHQAIGQYFGAHVGRGGLMHGKTSPVLHNQDGVFQDLPTPLEATRYHSLLVMDDNIPDCLEVNARLSESDGGHIMGLRHRELPLHGVQFHPESVATEFGHQMLANFLDIADVNHGPVPKKETA